MGSPNVIAKALRGLFFDTCLLLTSLINLQIPNCYTSAVSRLEETLQQRPEHLALIRGLRIIDAVAVARSSSLDVDRIMFLLNLVGSTLQYLCFDTIHEYTETYVERAALLSMSILPALQHFEMNLPGSMADKVVENMESSPSLEQATFRNWTYDGAISFPPCLRKVVIQSTRITRGIAQGDGLEELKLVNCALPPESLKCLRSNLRVLHLSRCPLGELPDAFYSDFRSLESLCVDEEHNKPGALKPLPPQLINLTIHDAVGSGQELLECLETSSTTCTLQRIQVYLAEGIWWSIKHLARLEVGFECSFYSA